MKIKDLLHIGSIVLLKDGEKRLMIIGIMQTDKGKDFDYLGEPYPEGHIGEGFQYLFNHEDISKIVFRGFEDAERTEFLSKLAESFESKSLSAKANKKGFLGRIRRENKNNI